MKVPFLLDSWVWFYKRVKINDKRHAIIMNS